MIDVNECKQQSPESEQRRSRWGTNPRDSPPFKFEDRGGESKFDFPIFLLVLGVWGGGGGN